MKLISQTDEFMSNMITYGENSVFLFEKNTVLFYNFKNSSWSKRIIENLPVNTTRSYSQDIRDNFIYFYKLDYDAIYKISLESFLVTEKYKINGEYQNSSSIFVKERNKLYLFGEMDGILSEKFRYIDMEKHQIHYLEDFPIKVNRMRTIYYKDNIYCFGGISDYGHLNHLYQYNISKNQWTLLETMNNPPGRYLHGMCELNGVIYVFGGMNRKKNVVYFGDLWCLDLNSNISHMENLLEFSSQEKVVDVYFHYHYY